MSFENKITEFMQSEDYLPLSIDQLAKRLKLNQADRSRFKTEINRMVRNGVIVRLKKDRLCLTGDADLISGRIRFRPSGLANLIPDVKPGAARKDFLPIRAEDTSVALHGDHVLVRRVRARQVPRYRKGARRRAVSEKIVETGRVIRILERARETLTGTLQRSRLYYFVIPDDPRIFHDILVPDPTRTKLRPRPKINDKVIVRLSEWKQRHLNPEGKIIAVLGKTHIPATEYKALLHRYDLKPDFPEEVIRETASIPQKVSKNECQNRLDLRSLYAFTIDPDDAKDFDDALTLEKQKDGGFRVGIHIADVSAYVKPNSALDREAQTRGNSTYLVGAVIPMLPHAISNGICSLVEGQDRLTKSVFLTFSSDGRIKGTEFANTVIHSRKRLSYQQAFALLKEKDLQKIQRMSAPAKHLTGFPGSPLSDLSIGELKDLRERIRTLWDIASKLRTQRMTKGSLDLDMPEAKIYLDEKGYVECIKCIQYDESHQLIEEFMLAANEAVARSILNAGLPLLHRVHDKPDSEKLDELREYMLALHIQTGNLVHRREMVALLSKLKYHPQGHLLRIQVLRSFKPACYRADADGHYGLNKSRYTHFTSPIRRYTDLVVHRVFDQYLIKRGLPTALQGPRMLYKHGRLSNIAQHLSITEQNSTEAERESTKIKQIEYFKREADKPRKTVFEAVIIDIKNHGMFIELTDSMAFGLVHISTLRDDLYSLSPDGTCLSGRRKNKEYLLGQKIKVVVERVNPFKRQIDFSPA